MDWFVPARRQSAGGRAFHGPACHEKVGKLGASPPKLRRVDSRDMNSVAAAPRVALAEAAASTTAEAAVAARRAAGFVPRLEGFRGYGCLMVALVHVWQTPWNATQTLRSAPDLADPFWYGMSKVYAVVFNGHAALTMFFVMSGFVLSRSLD